MLVWHGVIQTGELSFPQSFYLPEILEQLKTNIQTNFPFEMFFSICDSTAEFLFFHVTTVHMAAESGCLVGFEMCGISGASFRYGFPAGEIAIRQSINIASFIFLHRIPPKQIRVPNWTHFKHFFITSNLYLFRSFRNIQPNVALNVLLYMFLHKCIKGVFHFCNS